jgi:hypothetical protein
MVTRKLGKKRAIYDQRTLRLSQYLVKEELPPLPASMNLYQKVSKFGMQGNDEYGNCVVVGMAHAIQTWSANAAREQIIPKEKVIDTYLDATGGDDNGLVVLDFLKFWRKNPLWGHPLGAFVALNPRSMRQLSYACYLFGGVILGVALPEYIEDAKVWDLPDAATRGDTEPGSWGGHCVHLGAYGQARRFLISTWDEKMPTTAGFVNAYADEAYALLSLDWFTKDHKTPTGFDWKKLRADLDRIARG